MKTKTVPNQTGEMPKNCVHFFASRACIYCNAHQLVAPSAPVESPATEDKSEGVYLGAFAAADPSHLPVDEKFIFWLDDEGDYMLQLQREPGLQAHGSTPEDAVYAMRQVLDLAGLSEIRKPDSPTFAYSPDTTDEQVVRQEWPDINVYRNRIMKRWLWWRGSDPSIFSEHFDTEAEAWADARSKLPAALPEATQEDAVWALIHSCVPPGQVPNEFVRATWPLWVELVERRKG